MVSSACCEPTSEASTGLTGEPFSDSVEILKISSRRCGMMPKRRMAPQHARDSAEGRTILGDVRQGGSGGDRVHSRGAALKGRQHGVTAVTRGSPWVPTAHCASQYLRVGQCCLNCGLATLTAVTAFHHFLRGKSDSYRRTSAGMSFLTM